MINELLERLRGYIPDDYETREVFSGVFGITSVRIVALCISFIQSVVLARLLGVSEYGAYSYAYSIATLLALVSLQGFDRHAMRETAVLLQKKEWSSLLGVRRLAEYFTLITSAVLGVLAYIWFSHSDDTSRISITSAAALVGLLLPFIALLRVEAGLLRGYRSVVRSQLPDQIVRPVIFILLILVFAVSGLHANGANAIILHSIAACSALAWSFYELKRIIPREIRFSKPSYDLRSQYASSFAMGGIALLGALLTQIPLLILGTIGTADQTGSFAASLRLSQLVTFVFAATNMALGPSMARLYNTGNTQQMAKIAQITAFLAFCLSLPIALIFFFFSMDILSIYGDGFDQSSPALRVLIISQLFHVSMGSVSLWLMMSKNEIHALIATVVSVIITIVLCLILIPKFGSLGGAFAAAGGMIILNSILAIKVIRLLGFNPTCYGLLFKKGGST